YHHVSGMGKVKNTQNNEHNGQRINRDSGNNMILLHTKIILYEKLLSLVRAKNAFGHAEHPSCDSCR
ncbi:hypothetical protein ABTL88_19390, partial [Acinetobacter baumannii]